MRSGAQTKEVSRVEKCVSGLFIRRGKNNRKKEVRAEGRSSVKSTYLLTYYSFRAVFILIRERIRIVEKGKRPGIV